MNKLKSNVKSMLFSALLLGATGFAHAQQTSNTESKGWKMQPVTIQTRWAKNVSPENALKEYPRPQLVRKAWTNLNGLWDYAITQKDSRPVSYAGQILVPYPIESALSGVKKVLLPEQSLWYKRNLNIKKGSGRKLLHFGAVDFQATVFVNGKEAGSHEGGYTGFDLDITDLLQVGSNELLVNVWDPTDRGFGPHGKQVLQPQNIYYTGSSGIWQTVWLEEVPESYIERLTITPDIDRSLVNITVHAKSDVPVELTVAGKTVKGRSNAVISVKIDQPKLWSPASPYLYDFGVKMGGDQVKSYFGMRKVGYSTDSKGNKLISLNNKPYYNLATLDQGFWPDGLYTAPTDEALKFDIEAIKAMGFNTIRKHIKIEPARWYYHADKLGMLVWQDMVNPNQGLPEGSKAAFEKESKETMDQLHNYPSIVCWVLFNEHWGQYDQKRLTEWMKDYDKSRIVSGHTGEYIFIEGKETKSGNVNWISSDIADVHSYPFPLLSEKQPKDKVQIVGEFGGIGVFIPDHQWNPNYAWGYIQEKPGDLKNKYRAMTDSLVQMEKKQGLAGSVYTQPFDVEGEQNGLMTYDREVVKIPFAQLREIHAPLNPDVKSSAWMSQLANVKAQDADLTDPEVLNARAIEAFKSGSREPKVMQAVVRSVSKTTDAGFALMVREEAAFRKEMGTQGYSAFMNNMLFSQAIQPMFEEKKTWAEIAASMKSRFGSVGEEVYLRIKCIGTMNDQNWAEFKPVAKELLDKYGQYQSAAFRAQLEKAIAEN